MSTYDMLKAHYATCSDDELKALGSAPDLPAEAKRALADEIAQRGMDPEVRRQATVSAIFMAMEQEKQERLQKSRRILQTGVAVGLACLAILVCYTFFAAFPHVGTRGKLLFFPLVFAAAIVVGLYIRRRNRRNNAAPHDSSTDTSQP